MSNSGAFKLDVSLIRRLATKIQSTFGGDPSDWESMCITGTATYARLYALHHLERFTREWNEFAVAENRPELRWEGLDDTERHELLVVAAGRHFEADLDLAADCFEKRILGEPETVLRDFRSLRWGFLDDVDEIVVYRDDFGNTATVKRRKCYPYKGAPHKKPSFVLTLTADYDNDFAYHVSTYETMDELEAALAKLSGGTWH